MPEPALLLCSSWPAGAVLTMMPDASVREPEQEKLVVGSAKESSEPTLWSWPAASLADSSLQKDPMSVLMELVKDLSAWSA